MKLKKLNIQFTQIPNEVLYNENISLKAKGLFCYMQAKPDDWEFSHERIALENKDGESSVLTALKELELNGFLERRKLQDSKGRWEWQHILKVPDLEKPDPDFQGQENRGTNKEIITNKETQINSNKLATEVADTLIPELIKEFEKLDPVNKTYYGNKTQRAACKFLIDHYGFEECKQMVNILAERGHEVFNCPNTPVRLRDNWTKILRDSAYRKHIEDKNKVECLI